MAASNLLAALAHIPDMEGKDIDECGAYTRSCFKKEMQLGLREFRINGLPRGTVNGRSPSLGVLRLCVDIRKPGFIGNHIVKTQVLSVVSVLVMARSHRERVTPHFMA